MSEDDIMVAKGISSFSSDEIKKIMGKNEKSILPLYGENYCGEVIHRDCLVVFDNEI
jgi:glutamate 5-kinase